LETLRDQNRIKECDHIILILSVWYESVPAYNGRFVDMVFSKGWAYDLK